MITGKKLGSIRASEEVWETLDIFVKGLTKVELEEKILGYIRILTKQGYKNNELLYEYLSADVKDYCCELIVMSENRSCPGRVLWK